MMWSTIEKKTVLKIHCCSGSRNMNTTPMTGIQEEKGRAMMNICTIDNDHRMFNPLIPEKGDLAIRKNFQVKWMSMQHMVCPAGEGVKSRKEWSI